MPGRKPCDEWSEISLEKAEWRIPAARMKMERNTCQKRPHMMQAWADYLDQLREAAGVGTLKKKADRTSPASRASALGG
jgi:hypothetical protein